MSKTTAPLFNLPRNALSPDGYIVNQCALSGIPNGRNRSDYNGCGWISVFNTLKALGRERPAGEIVLAIRRGLLLGGLLGTSPFFIRRFLKKAGLFVKTALTKRSMARKLAGADAAILFYFHRRGAHFITLLPCGEQLRILNLTASSNDIRRTLPELLSLFRFGLLLTVTRRPPESAPRD